MERGWRWRRAANFTRTLSENAADIATPD